MSWNWQRSEWPDFTYDKAALDPLERQFLLGSGEFVGTFRHVGPGDRDELRVELISDEAVKTSAIEGEVLDRDSVQSSLRQQFGLTAEAIRVPRAERGLAEMMVDLYRRFAEPLGHETLFGWHRMLIAGNRFIREIGAYRTHADAMQIVSARLGEPGVFFEAPPSKRMTAEMDAFVGWFNDTAPGGARPLLALARAGVAHLYFVSVHPFEDGNGRVGRAIAEKALAQNLGQPTLIALAYTIERARAAYYAALRRNSTGPEVTDWLIWFGRTVLEAQSLTIRRVGFHIAEAQFYGRVRGQLNERQEKVIARLFRAGIEGFKGGLSADNYVSITRTSRATATRDLQDLVTKRVLTRTGALRHTRYFLDLSEDAG